MAGSKSLYAGKKFESRVKEGLDRLEGLAERMQDGGSVCKTRTMCDYIYRNRGGFVWAIECKSTEETSFPYRNIQEHQVERLLKWTGPHTAGVFAIEYRANSTRKEPRMFIIFVNDLYNEMHLGGRKSLTAERAAEIGTETFRVKGAYDMSFLG